METMKFKTGELIIDSKLVEIRHINAIFVSRYRQAMRSGEIFPKMIVEKSTKRIVSGNHRETAYLQEYGTEYEVEVIVKKYANELEVLKEFAKENASHGNALDDFTRKRLTHAMLALGATEESVASIFNISVKRVKAIIGGGVLVQIGDELPEELPAKQGFEPNHAITMEEYQEHIWKDRGFSIFTQCNQIIRWLQKGFVPKTEKNKAILKLLGNEIKLFLK